MATQIEAALFAANVYGNLNSVRDPQNTLPIPDGWTSNVTAHPEFFAVENGFLARAYQRGNEIVIAFGGTTNEEGQASLDWVTGSKRTSGQRTRSAIKSDSCFRSATRTSAFDQRPIGHLQKARNV